MEGNIRIYRLLKGRGTGPVEMILPDPKARAISFPIGEGNIISNSSYHDPRAVCLS